MGASVQASPKCPSHQLWLLLFCRHPFPRTPSLPLPHAGAPEALPHCLDEAGFWDRQRGPAWGSSLSEDS